MVRKKREPFKFSLLLYALWFFVWQYSVTDMQTSTNAYQQQGDRSSVYIYLIGIIGVLGCYFVLNFIYGRKLTFSPMVALLFMIAWVILDNLILGNFFSSARWTALTHSGLVVWWFFAIVFAYYYPADNKSREKQLFFFIGAMFVYYCYKFIEVAITSNAEHDETTVLNLVYRVVVFVPFIYMMENKKLKNILMIVIFAFAVISMKRGAIIILPAMLLVGSFFDPNRKGFARLVFAYVVAIVVAVLIIQVANEVTGGFLSERFTWESLMDGSSRSEKYATAIAEISIRGPAAFLLGVGSIPKSGVHNEILEFLYTFGFIGLITYIVFIVSLVRRFRFLCKNKSQYAGIYGMILTFIFVVGLYSGVCFTHSTFYIMLTLGIVERKISEEGLCQIQLR